MMLRPTLLLLVFCIILVVTETSKNKGDVLLSTTLKSDVVGKKYHLNKAKKKKGTKAKLPSLCKLPQEIGPCRAAKERFYYDLTENECKPFTYGGCRGNKNNFQSTTKCQKTCKV